MLYPTDCTPVAKSGLFLSLLVYPVVQARPIPTVAKVSQSYTIANADINESASTNLAISIA